jgi:hypothetical protein
LSRSTGPQRRLSRGRCIGAGRSIGLPGARAGSLSGRRCPKLERCGHRLAVHCQILPGRREARRDKFHRVRDLRAGWMDERRFPRLWNGVGGARSSCRDPYASGRQSHRTGLVGHGLSRFRGPRRRYGVQSPLWPSGQGTRRGASRYGRRGGHGSGEACRRCIGSPGLHPSICLACSRQWRGRLARCMHGPIQDYMPGSSRYPRLRIDDIARVAARLF